MLNNDVFGLTLINVDEPSINIDYHRLTNNVDSDLISNKICGLSQILNTLRL